MTLNAAINPLSEKRHQQVGRYRVARQPRDCPFTFIARGSKAVGYGGRQLPGWPPTRSRRSPADGECDSPARLDNANGDPHVIAALLHRATPTQPACVTVGTIATFRATGAVHDLPPERRSKPLSVAPRLRSEKAAPPQPARHDPASPLPAPMVRPEPELTAAPLVALRLRRGCSRVVDPAGGVSLSGRARRRSLRQPGAVERPRNRFSAGAAERSAAASAAAPPPIVR